MFCSQSKNLLWHYLKQVFKHPSQIGMLVFIESLSGSSSFYLVLEFNAVNGRVVLMKKMRTWCKQQVISAAGDFYVFLMVGRLDNWRRCRTQLTRDWRGDCDIMIPHLDTHSLHSQAGRSHTEQSKSLGCKPKNGVEKPFHRIPTDIRNPKYSTPSRV